MTGSPEPSLVMVLGRPNPLLARWLAARERHTIWPAAETLHRVPAARNAMVRAFLSEPAPDWLVMLDRDIVPVPESAPFFSSPADITSAEIVTRAGRASHPHTISAAALKIARRALEAIRPPWFGWPREGGCECAWFYGRAYRAGFRPVRAGVVGHRFPVTVLPGPLVRFDGEY